MMYEKLIKRLNICAYGGVNDCKGCKGCEYRGGDSDMYCFCKLIAEAADAIESQQTVLRAQKAALEAKQDKAREKLFADVTRKYRAAKGDARKAYRDVLDMICGSCNGAELAGDDDG